MTRIEEQITMLDNTTYKISDFDYELPQELIAQTPIEPRDASRLLVVHRDSGTLEHRHFRNIGAYLRPGDLLIANQSRVLPARLLGQRAESGGAVEVLLLAERPDLGSDYWVTRLYIAAEPPEEIASRDAPGRAFTPAVQQAIERVGRMPLPPYIHEKLADPERYQTVYARINGSAAAPTAGLHFTPRLLQQLRQLGVRVGFVTLHV